MPYKVILHRMDVEIAEKHYIHAMHTRDAKRIALKFQCGNLYRKIEYIRMTEFEVREECGVYED